jgi:orotidine-5'-phosphate decarboxylase
MEASAAVAPNGFYEKLERRVLTTNSLLCVGIDPTCALDELFDVVTATIEQTQQHAAAYKFNPAYFLQYGADGLSILEQLLHFIPDDIPTILDANICDTGNTCQVMKIDVFHKM